MKNKHIDDPLDVFGIAYEMMLERALEGLEELKEEAHELEEKTEPVVPRLIDKAKRKAIKLQELTLEEAEQVSQMLKQDLADARVWMDETGGELKDWVGFENGIIRMELENLFKAAADKEVVDMTRLNMELEQARIHTGRIIEPGVLVCNHCGEIIHFGKAGRVPPCPKCSGTEFYRGIEST